MKDLGKTKILGLDVYVDRSRCQYGCANMVGPKYIDEILNEVQYGNNEKSSCRMEEVETRFMCF
jgi:hypothetical protein